MNIQFPISSMPVYVQIQRKPKEHRLPSKFQIAKNATSAALRVAKAVIKGEGICVDAATMETRLATCEQCEYYRPKDGRCAHEKCGCYLKSLLLKKTKLKTEKCPERKW